MSPKLTRRQWLTAGSAGIFTARKGWGYASQTTRIEIRPSSEIARIRPELHGHFAEHLGSCIYGGLWVGKNSPIPNINGHRRQAVEYLKAVGIPVLRWPGGCFADDYHWRDGIGPAGKRPSRVNISWGMYTEDNSFGTHEFLELCRLINAEPYIAGNVGSGTPAELRDWVEYCNYPSGSTLSDERAVNGSPSPFDVKFWGVGNENWGCGGRMTPEEYATLYRRFSNYIRRPFGSAEPYLIACGPSRNDTDWTRRFLATIFEKRGTPIHGYAMHFYSRAGERLPATGFTAEAVDQQLATFAELEKAVLQQRAILDGYDPERQIGLLIDEWGVWDGMVPAEEKKYGRLWQQITMRSAVAAALGLNVFHRQADKIVMGNIAQTVNVLHSLLLTHEQHCIRTPTYYVFDMLKQHRDATAVEIAGEGGGPLDLSASASVREGELALTMVNPKHDSGLTVRVAAAGRRITEASGQLLHHTDWNACNTFEAPDTITPRHTEAATEGDGLRVELPPLSVLALTARI